MGNFIYNNKYSCDVQCMVFGYIADFLSQTIFLSISHFGKFIPFKLKTIILEISDFKLTTFAIFFSFIQFIFMREEHNILYNFSFFLEFIRALIFFPFIQNFKAITFTSYNIYVAWSFITMNSISKSIRNGCNLYIFIKIVSLIIVEALIALIALIIF